MRTKLRKARWEDVAAAFSSGGGGFRAVKAVRRWAEVVGHDAGHPSRWTTTLEAWGAEDIEQLMSDMSACAPDLQHCGGGQDVDGLPLVVAEISGRPLLVHGGRRARRSQISSNGHAVLVVRI